MGKITQDRKQAIRSAIEAGKTALGIELGSTRIKAVLIGEDHAPIASGGYEWQNTLENNIWTYHLEDVWTGLKACFQDLAQNVQKNFDARLTTVGALGVSAMMHGYLAFDKDGALLAPFRTWRNTITQQAAAELTEAFAFNIPQRWSVAHLYQATLNGEPHVKDVRFLTTLSGFVHWRLTGEKVLGIGDAVGMFPIDQETLGYHPGMLAAFGKLIQAQGFPWQLDSLLPRVLLAGADAGELTPEGARRRWPGTTGTGQR